MKCDFIYVTSHNVEKHPMRTYPSELYITIYTNFIVYINIYVNFTP